LAELENILGVFEGRKPSAALTHVAGELLRVAKTCEPLSEAQATTLGADDELKRLEDEVMQNIYGVHGRRVGPARNAREQVGDCVKLAIKLRYPINHQVITKQLAWFLLALVTEGFDDEDINGTQMGSYLGTWRGGGFS
jgi:hypothetical protein